MQRPENFGVFFNKYKQVSMPSSPALMTESGMGWELPPSRWALQSFDPLAVLSNYLHETIKGVSAHRKELPE